MVAKGSTVTITVAKALPTATARRRRVHRERGQAAMRGAGLKVSATTVEVQDEGQDGLVRTRARSGARG